MQMILEELKETNKWNQKTKSIAESNATEFDH